MNSVAPVRLDDGQAAAPRPGRPLARILVIDDNKELLRGMKAYLGGQGYRVESSADPRQALRLVSRLRPDLVILDIMMPQMDGLEVLKALRQKSQVPTMFLTAKKGDVSQIMGFKLGADDYVSKPFCMEALAARVEALLKRRRAPEKDGAPPIRFGAVSVDAERREVLVNDKPAEMTNKEFDLLVALCEADGKVLSRQDLMSRVWGYPPDCDLTSRTVDQHIARIRKKLGADGRRILTVTHLGYRLKAEN